MQQLKQLLASSLQLIARRDFSRSFGNYEYWFFLLEPRRIFFKSIAHASNAAVTLALSTHHSSSCNERKRNGNADGGSHDAASHADAFKHSEFVAPLLLLLPAVSKKLDFKCLAGSWRLHKCNLFRHTQYSMLQLNYE